MADPEPHIGTLNEGSLHAAMKEHYAQAGDAFEVPLDGFVIDIMRDQGGADELLIEVQTASFASMGNKLDHVLEEHRVLLVHPIATVTTLERPGKPRRKSPMRGSLFSIFDELVSIPTLLDHPNLALDVVLVTVTKAQEPDAKARRGRGGWRTVDRRLDDIVETHRFNGVDDLVALLPPDLPPRFTTKDLADQMGCKRAVAQQIAYCFRAAAIFDPVDRTRAGIIYRRSD